MVASGDQRWRVGLPAHVKFIARNKVGNCHRDKRSEGNGTQILKFGRLTTEDFDHNVKAHVEDGGGYRQSHPIFHCAHLSLAPVARVIPAADPKTDKDKAANRCIRDGVQGTGA
ncbi:MAG: hypothetical protein PGMFKBFP_03409 [Anaerolineales bacterium]|nr:hypothetical protein [Anaerolineales bacterium]